MRPAASGSSSAAARSLPTSWLQAGISPGSGRGVRPAAGFADIRPLFEDELGRLEFLDDEPQQWEAAYRRIREMVCLLAPDGRLVPEFLLHIEGEDAWWRWSDESFPEKEDKP